MTEKLYTPLDPYTLPLPGDSGFGGVEQQMPSAADINATSTRPIKADWKTNYDSRSPRQILTDFNPEDYSNSIPDMYANPREDVPSKSAQPLYTPLEETPKQALYTPIAVDETQKPYFPGDPTADVANTIKGAGEALVDDPGGLGRGLGGGAVGAAGMAQAAIQELNPYTHKAGESYDPVSMLDRIEAQGQRATNAVIDPSNQAPLGPGYKAGSELLAVPWALTGGALSKLAKDNGFPQVGAAIELAGIYTMLSGGIHGLKSGKYTPTLENTPKPVDSAATGAVRDFVKDPKNQFDNAATEIANLGHATEKIVGDRQAYTFDATKPLKATLKEIATQGKGNASQVLDVLADHPEVPESLQEIARAEQQRAIDIGLDEAPVVAGPHPNGNLKAPASFTYETDTIGIHHERGYEPQAMLHEIGHAIQGAAIRMYEEGRAITPEQKGIAEIVGRLDEGFKKSKEDYRKGLDATEGLKFDLAEQAGKHVGDTRGFTNLREFATEVRVNPKFQDILRKQRVTDPAVIRRLAPEWHSPIKNMWAVVHRVLNSIIAPDRIVNVGHSQFDLALSNVMQLGEKVTPEIRTSMKRGGPSTRGIERVNERVAGRVALQRFKLTEPMQRIAALLQNTVTKSEFRDRLAVEFGHPDWANYVAKYADRLWVNKKQVIEAAGANRTYEKLTPHDRLNTADPRTIPEFFKQEFGDRTEPLNQGEDISSRGTMVFGAASVAMHKGIDGIAGALTKFVVNKVSENRALNAKLHAVVMTMYQPFKKLSFGKQDRVMQEAVYWDSHRKELETLGLQWPTREMLEARDMTPEHIAAYEGLTKGVDYLYRLLNQSLAKIGQPPIRQVPGYMPHIFKGDFKVLVRLRDLTDPKNPVDRVVAVKGYQTVYGANAYIKALNAGKHDMPGYELRPEIDPDTKKPYRVIRLKEMHDDLMSSVQEHTTAYENVSKLDPGIIKWMESIDAASMRGFTKHVLERDGVHGYIGDPYHPGKTKVALDRLGINLDKKPLRGLYENYAKSVVDHYTNTIFQTEVIHPLLDHIPEPYEHGTTFGSMLANTTDLTSYIRRLGYNVTGQPLNHAWLIDKFMREASIAAGFSPRLYRDALSTIRNVFTQFALRFNVGFLVGNSVQSAHVLALLEMVNVQRLKDGHKNNPNTFVSLGKAMLNLAHGDPWTVSMVDKARFNHVLDPLLDADIMKAQPKNALSAQVNKLAVNPHIEGMSRNIAFRIALEHFRHIYGDTEAAYNAASNTMKMTMVDYDRSSRPLMFQQLGSAGEFVSPFQVYRNQYMSNFGRMVGVITRDPLNLHSYRPMMTNLGVLLLLAGAVGAPMAAEYGALQQVVNKLWPEANMPTLQEALAKMHVPNWTTIGTLSDLTKHIPGFENGIYIGSSVNAIDTTQGMFAQGQWLDAIKDLAGAGARYVGHAVMPDRVAPVVRADVYGPARQALPAALKPLWDKMNQPSGSDIASKSTTLEGAYHRTPADEHATWIGKRSNTEFQERTVNQIVESNSKDRQKEIKRWVQAGADLAEEHDLQSNVAEVMQGLAKYEIPEDKAREMIFKEIESRRLTPAQRDVQSDTPESRRRILDRQSMERK